ncbi:MAG: hypothetical protein CHKLHMKO_00200 [Candidatus Argoarchaeum ethanivorans]|uniref:Uncharacterized protein n=1 Tax=Candidatus Argoarchaeum ethanivorans TaxID=2608793 RepID=A0A811T3H8_9EURY|nr:MAG: hypothetical protein CHKLHMKO_00200 [Candidatus Argoarchaeum ethanivorans]
MSLNRLTQELTERLTQDCRKKLENRKDSDYFYSTEKQSQVKTLEKQIDQLVYKLYDLTPEEMTIVENFNKGK